MSSEASTANIFDKYRTEFDNALPKLLDDVLAEDEKNSEIENAITWLRNAMEYNLQGGKRNRGLMVPVCLDYLKQGQLTKEEVSKAITLGWCVEWLQAYFLVSDDIVDQSELRRGKPCWYKQPDVGLIAINDALLIETCIYKLLKNTFRQTNYYVDLLEIFHEVSRLTGIGQELDVITSNSQNIDNFTMKKYKSIVKYKTAFYSFYLPVALAIHMTGVKDENVFIEARTILMELGEYFQIQDDYLDCFGDPSVTGKIGTDIQEGKCCWLVIKALERVTPQQKQLLHDNYALNDPDAVQKVKDLYNQLNLQKEFLEYEENSYCRILELIEKHSKSLPREMFLELVKKIYKRKK